MCAWKSTYFLLRGRVGGIKIDLLYYKQTNTQFTT
jgi:hypothetical protein